MMLNRYFEPQHRKTTGAEKKDVREVIFEALAARRPPGTLRLMLDGQRPVVYIRTLINSGTQLPMIVEIFNCLGERIDQYLYVLYPLDICRKLAAEDLDFEFEDEAKPGDRWKTG